MVSTFYEVKWNIELRIKNIYLCWLTIQWGHCNDELDEISAESLWKFISVAVDLDVTPIFADQVTRCSIVVVEPFS